MRVRAVYIEPGIIIIACSLPLSQFRKFLSRGNKEGLQTRTAVCFVEGKDKPPLSTPLSSLYLGKAEIIG